MLCCLGIHILPQGNLTDILIFVCRSILTLPFLFPSFSDFIQLLPPHYFVSQCFIALSSIFHPLSISPFKHKAFSNHPSDEEWLIYHILFISSLLMALLLAKRFPTYSLALIWTGRILLSLPYFFRQSVSLYSMILMYSRSANPTTYLRFFFSSFSPPSSFIQNIKFTVDSVRQQ